jgi:hypothetical protein
MMKKSAILDAFSGSSCGLNIWGYKLVPNDPLRVKIAAYPPEVVTAVLSDHPEIVDSWLGKLHKKYLALKKSSESDSDPVARYNLPPFQEFEKHFQSWRDGEIITIFAQRDKILRIRNEKRRMKTPETPRAADQRSTDPRFTCGMCSAIFDDSEEYARHRMREIEEAKNGERRHRGKRLDATRKDLPPIPIWVF